MGRVSHSPSPYVAFKKISAVNRDRPDGRLLAAARHNKRAIAAEMGAGSHIDPSRSHLNKVISGPQGAQAVVEEWRRLISEAGATVKRNDAVVCIEALFSLPAWAKVDVIAYFQACTEWVGVRLGCPILTSDVHLDEAQPHCHVLIAPLVNGKLLGGDLLGGRPAMKHHQADLWQKVGRLFGLKRPDEHKRGASRARLAAAVVRELQRTDDSILHSPVWPQARAAIDANPTTFADALGVEVSSSPHRLRTVTEIMISTGKGPKRESEPGKYL